MKLNKDFSKELKALSVLLGADFAIISAIDGSDYEVVAVASNIDMISQGDHFVTQNTYCNEVLNKNDMVMYTHVGGLDEMVHHPIYTAIQLEAYIGEPLRKNGQIVGTLNFSSFRRKTPSFSVDEIARVQQLARQIEAAML